MSNGQTQTFAGGLLEGFGSYSERVPEYRLAVEKAFYFGLFRSNTPVLDLGCGPDPYEGLLKFLRDFCWDGHYVGVDKGFDKNAELTAEDDGRVMLVAQDFDADPDLPFPPTPDHPIKQFATGFLLEVADKLENLDAIIEQLKWTCASVVVVGPSDAFTGWRPPHADRVGLISDAWLLERGFQERGCVNLNGRPSATAQLYASDRPDLCSEVWGVWCDERAEYLNRDRETKGYKLALEDGDISRKPMTLVEMEDDRRKRGLR